MNETRTASAARAARTTACALAIMLLGELAAAAALGLAAPPASVLARAGLAGALILPVAYLAARRRVRRRRRPSAAAPPAPREDHRLREHNEELTRRLQRNTTRLVAANRSAAHEAAQRRRAERELRLVKFAVDHAPEAVFFLRASDRRFTYVNETVSERLGYSREELLDMAVPDLHDAHELVDTWDEVQAGLARQGAATLETVHVARGGARIDVELSIRNVRYGDDDVLVVFARDVRERKRQEEQRRDDEARRRRSERLEAIGRLAGGVAHDFNNMLTVINGEAGLLLDAPGLPPRQRRRVEHILDAGERSASLAGKLLAYGRRAVLRPQRLDVDDLVRDGAPLLRRAVREDIAVDLRLGDVGAARVDPDGLQRALINLAVNARDAMPRGGWLTIETRREDLGDPTESTEMLVGAETVVLTVRDTGVGMDPDTQSRAFEPFFTTKKVGEGSGLGLASVHGFAKQSGGFVRVRSRPGEGTEVSIHLPAEAAAPPGGDASGARRAPARAAAAARRPPPRPVGRPLALVVEDEELVRGLLVEALRGEGWRVLEAVDGADGLATLEARRDVALLVTDVVMPALGGVELVEQARARGRRVPTIFLSGYPDAAGRELPDDAGCRFLGKPVRPRALLEAAAELTGAGAGAAA